MVGKSIMLSVNKWRKGGSQQTEATYYSTTYPRGETQRGVQHVVAAIRIYDSLRKRTIILCVQMRKNKNLCTRYKAKLPER